MSGQIQLVDGDGAAAIPLVRELFLEYSAWLGVDLCFQGFEQELATLPGRYAPPDGAILLGYVDGTLAGCVAMRVFEPGICEMKRLWVREAFRRTGIGARLADAVIARARAAGHGRMRLDTLQWMKPALALYASRGFVEIPAYYDNPDPAVVYLEKAL